MGIFFAAPIDEYPDYDRVTSIPTNVEEKLLYPAANLLTFDPTQVHINADNFMTINWDFGAAKSFDVVSLVHTNFLDTTTWTVSGSLDNVTFTTLRSSAPALAHVVAGQTAQNKRFMLKKNHTLLNLAAPVSYRYLRIAVSEALSTFRPSVGRLFVGLKYVPSTGWQYGSTFDFTDLSRRDRTDRGALVVDPQMPNVGASVKMDFLTKTEMYDFIWEFNYWRGAAREILACLDVDDIPRMQKNLLYCTISEGRKISFDSYNTHSVVWNLESIA
jgi:hypothetical protein